MLTRFKHQEEIFAATKDLPSFALLWEMRVGKNLPILDTALYLYNTQKIQAVLVIAPSGVHSNWSRKVIPPEQPTANIFEWSGKSGKHQQRMLAKFLDSPTLLWVTVNVEALVTDAWQDFQSQLTKCKRTMRVIDESDVLKTPQAKRTKYAINTTKDFPYNRILTGTSAPNSPFDLWSQYACMDKAIIGQDKFASFKARYGIFKTVRYGGPSFQQLESYRDLGHLTERIMRASSRLTQRDVYDNLPDLIATTSTFQMTKEQAQAYADMRDDMLYQVNEGLILTASQAITRMMRLQQISRGFITQGELTFPIPGDNPAVERLLHDLTNIEGKVIIWCNFTEDVNCVTLALTGAGHANVRYDGQVSKEQRFENLQSFLNDPSVKCLVGTPATGGVGLDVSVADTTYFYSHSYKLRERLQAIARNQGPNQKAKKLLLVSLVGEATGDQAIINRLEEKRAMQAGLMGDDIEPDDHVALLKQFLTGDQP